MATTTTSGRDLAGELAFLTRALKAPTLRQSVARLADRARTEGWTHEEFLAACLQREVAARQAHGGEGRIRAAHFPARKSLEEFDFDHARGLKRDTVAHLGTLDFVTARDNVVFLGPPGTGKMHLVSRVVDSLSNRVMVSGMAERGRPKAPLVLTDDERQTLERWSRRATTAQALALRCKIVLACAEGATNKAVAERLGVWPQTVAKWRGRFVRDRLEGLSDEPRPGRPRTITDAQVEQVLTKTLEEPPPNRDTHWSTRSMARQVGLSQTAVSRIWRAFGLKPHLQETWKLSTDPQFIDKVRDIVGLYLDPPEAALVLCVDEKSQIQALDRAAPSLPLLPTTPARRSHDYVRNGTTSLFAALDVASGTVISATHRRHRHQEFLKFLRTIDRNVPAELDVHLVCDNYGTHKTPEIKRWFLRHPRFQLHLTPTYSSWLNLVERWFAELTTRKLRRSAHRSVAELEADLRAWIDAWNQDPKPFVWHKTADEILDSLAGYLHLINNSGH